MKKTVASFGVFFLVFSATGLFAQMPVTAPGVVSSLGDLSKIGVVAAITGRVEVMTPGAAGRVVQSGEEIFIGDEVKTDALGHLQILLLDETVFTIGPNSAITIDKFIYDPTTHAGNVEASITKGVFRYISGKIAAKKPENVTIKLPTATIGIRGTIVAGEVSATRSMAMLLGPGSRNETGATIGSFVMSGTGANSSRQEHVNRTGFGVSVDPTGSLSGVFQVPETQLQHLTTALLPSQEQGGRPAGEENNRSVAPGGRNPSQGSPGGSVPGSGPTSVPMRTTHFFGAGENMGKISGEQTYAGFQTTQQVNMMGLLQDDLNRDSTLASQDARHNSAIQNTTNPVAPLTKFAEMDVATRPLGFGLGLYHFSGSGVLSGVGNTFSFLVDIDFPNVDSPSDSTKSIGGGNSKVTVNVDGDALTYQLALDAWGVGENPFQYNGLSDSDGTPSPNLKADITVAIENAPVPNGNPLHDIAAQANVIVRIIDVAPIPDEMVASGSVVSDQRVSGAA